MRSSHAADLIASRFKSGNVRPVCLMGAPGSGKTQVAEQVARSLCTDDEEVGFLPLHAPSMSMEDMTVPVVRKVQDRECLRFAIDELLPLEGTNTLDRGIILLDEIAAGDNDVQKCMATMIQDRRLKGQSIKPGWMFVATGNRQEDRAGANRLLSHLANRMTRVDFEVNLDDWTGWYLNQDFCQVELVSFIRFKPELLMKFDPAAAVNPTPRSWVEGVGRSMSEVPLDQMHEVFAGDVGSGPATEFCSFLKTWRNLPNPDAVLLNPDKYDVPKEVDVRHALAGALAMRATHDNFGRLMTYAKRMPPEFTVAIVKMAMTKDKSVTATKAFVDWARGDGAALLS